MVICIEMDILDGWENTVSEYGYLQVGISTTITGLRIVLS